MEGDAKDVVTILCLSEPGAGLRFVAIQPIWDWLVAQSVNLRWSPEASLCAALTASYQENENGYVSRRESRTDCAIVTAGKLSTTAASTPKCCGGSSAVA